MPNLPSTRNTRKIDRLIRQAASAKGIRLKDTVFEHGHWWIEDRDGRFYDAVDAQGPGSVNGFDFDLVS